MPLFHPSSFDNLFVKQLPGDPEKRNFNRQVFASCWSPVLPTPVKNPLLIAYSPDVAKLFDLNEHSIQDPDFLAFFSGNKIAEGMSPYAACYGGHQFGVWAGQLGDGRAITLGEYVNKKRERWELQLKGAGPTPYSRNADGRAVLRSSIREFLCSEAMFALGVPTTRALSLIATGDGVVRDMMYDGNPKLEPGAIVCRVAPSFIRFGNFEILASRDNPMLLQALIDFTIDRDFSHIKGDEKSRRLCWFREICERTALLMAHWMRVGFVHGVMNTDNMSVLGLTIDYGPYGWIDNFDWDWTPNTTDAAHHRYAFGKQASVAQWNLARLAQALYVVMPYEEELKECLNLFGSVFEQTYQQMMANKFGFETLTTEKNNFIQDTLELMNKSQVDMTLFFRSLMRINPDQAHLSIFDDVFYEEDLKERNKEDWQKWLEKYVYFIKSEGVDTEKRVSVMKTVNPCYVLRNYMAQEAIDLAEKGDYSRVHELGQVLAHPYDENEAYNRYAAKRPEWAKSRVGCSKLSCSS